MSKFKEHGSYMKVEIIESINLSKIKCKLLKYEFGYRLIIIGNKRFNLIFDKTAF